jgi:hypothetical protein
MISTIQPIQRDEIKKSKRWDEDETECGERRREETNCVVRRR